MRHSEYEKRRRVLEKQYEEDLKLMRTAHDAKLRALEALWRGSPEAATTPEQVPSVGGDPRQAEHIQTTQPIEGQEVQRLPPGELKQAIRDVLPRLPEVFTRHDVEAALGFAPPRSSLVRLLYDMWRDNELAMEDISEGRQRTKYRKLTEPA